LPSGIKQAMPNQRSSSKPLLLAVDDNHAQCYVVARLAAAAGFQVKQAYSGYSALRYARLRPHAILLDVNMPDLDGFTVCKRLKRDPSTASIPIVFVSSTVPFEEGERRAMESGALAFIAAANAHETLPPLLKTLMDAGG
jgi:CheY-like chemotaxis protein